MTPDEHIAEAERLLTEMNERPGIMAERTSYVAQATAHATLDLALQGQQAAMCDHGSTGLCMSCVIAHDLLRPRS